MSTDRTNPTANTPAADTTGAATTGADTTGPTHRRARRLAAIALAATLAGGLAACDDNSTGAKAKLCEDFTTLSSLDAQAPHDPAALPDFVRSTALPTVRSLRAGLPASLRAPGQTIEDAFTALADTGNPETLMSPDVEKAKTAVGKHLFDTCDGPSVQVKAVDYGYGGLPRTIKAGPVDVAFANDGTEDHEMLVLRRNDGVTDSFEQLAANPEDLMGKATMRGVVYAAPGASSYSRLQLDAGTYFFVCTVPTHGDEADPHLNHGMHQQVTVS